MRRPTAPRRSGLALAGALVLALPAGVRAQSGPDFLFQRPVVTLGLRGGFAMARAGSAIFDDIRSWQTLERSDFQAATFGGSIAVRVAERVDIAFDVGYSKSESWSEYRDFVEEIDGRDVPIDQTTTFSRRPITLAAKVYLRDRGRSIGRFVWVPERWIPYVGAGAGWVWYDFKQSGSFVDFDTLEIFDTDIVSDGRAPTAHVFAGMEYSLTPRFVVSGEGRYSWGSSKMDSQFDGYDNIDLAGFQATVGLGIRW